MRGCLLLLALTALVAPAQGVSKLPDWAVPSAQAAQSEPGPQDAEAWVLLDRTEMAYTGGGEVRLRRLRLLKVLEERGTRFRQYSISGLGGKASRVKRLKGWNLRPDGELVKLDSDRVESMNDAFDEEFSTSTLTSASLGRVVKGSLLAFESLESLQSPIGPVASTRLLESLPVRTWELEVAKSEGWFNNLQAVEIKIDRRHFKPWVDLVEELPEGGMRVRGLPALPTDEGAHPHGNEVLPVVQVRFLDPKLPVAAMWGSWDAYACWTAETFRTPCQPTGLPGMKGMAGLEGLRSLWAWMRQGLTYKQVYLSPERGWVPEGAAEVGRKRYGDCKDLSAFFMGEAKGLGFTTAPALAAIGLGYMDADASPFPIFNHVISALRLEKSLGLAAEVDTKQGRFLLVDPTDMGTPLGFLSSAHEHGRVMICLPTGAVWVDVPATAILPQRLVFQLKGEVTGRELKGSINLKESGGYWGLRVAARRGGAKAIHDLLLRSYLDLPPTASLEVETISDPLDLDRPFEASVKVKHPEGFRIQQGGEGYLTDLGLPVVRDAIQRVGKARRYPIVSYAHGELDYQAELKFTSTVKPFVETQSVETPFRTFTWNSHAIPHGTGTLLKLNFHQQTLPMRFGFEALDSGLKAWKKDRTAVKTFRDDALAFRVGQP
ncbi:hypothetical protein GETHLI_05240 [Geothrix limicola]|uniref:DUF3857 domain-containing protein n=1 Tax=Geothrix limicola TaxID=2927978 RepID=A0ABQ5QB28_9BACT|nr:hypothetical protein GETHLI_05240 [Geothrix limicola]